MSEPGIDRLRFMSPTEITAADLESLLHDVHAWHQEGGTETEQKALLRRIRRILLLYVKEPVDRRAAWQLLRRLQTTHLTQLFEQWGLAAATKRSRTFTV